MGPTTRCVSCLGRDIRGGLEALEGELCAQLGTKTDKLRVNNVKESNFGEIKVRSKLIISF